MAEYARGNPAHWWRSRSVGSVHRSPHAMFISPMRRLASAGALVLLVIILLGVWYVTNPKRISRMSAALLSNVFGGPVTVKSGHLSFSGTLQLSGVELRAGEGAESLPLFSADQLEARFDWLSLLGGQLRATQLTAVRPTLSLIEDRATERWNYERLRPAEKPATSQPAAGPRPMTLPVMILREARVEWSEADNGRLIKKGDAVVDGQLAPDAVLASIYHFQINQRIDDPTVQRPTVVTGIWDVANTRFSAVTNSIPLTDRLRRSMPRQVRQWWDEHQLEGTLTQFRLTFDPEEGLVLGADMEKVSMVQSLQPNPGGATYAVAFRNVHGILTFGITHPVVRIANLRGEALGFGFEAEGSFRGFSGESPFDLSLVFPDVNLTDDYPPLFNAFPAARDLLQRIRPTGKMEVHCTLARPSPSGEVYANGEVICKDARMRFVHFPYPLMHVKGPIFFDHEQVDFRGVTAKGEENDVIISGTAGVSAENQAVDFTVSAVGAHLDERMAACLPERYKRIWDAFAVSATSDFVCRVVRTRDQQDPVVSVDLHITDGQGYYSGLPYRFTHGQGRMILEGDSARIENLVLKTGDDHSGKVTINGSVKLSGADGQSADLQPTLSLDADIPIDASLLHLMPTDFQERLDHAVVGGRVSFVGTGSRHPDGTPDIVGTLALRDGSFHTGDGQVTLDHVAAAATIKDLAIDISEIKASGGEHLQLHSKGRIDFSAQQADLELDASAADLPLPAAAPVFFPEKFQAIWKQYQPAGSLDGEMAAHFLVHFRPVAGAAPVDIKDYHAAINAKDIGLHNVAWPDAITNIRGRVTLAPTVIEMTDMTAMSGPLEMHWKAAYATESGQTTITGHVDSHGLPVKWLVVLPEGIGSFLTSQKAQANLSCEVTSLSRIRADQPWEFKGSVAIDKVATQGVWAIAADQCTLSGQGTWDPAGALDFDGRLTASNLGVSGHNIDTFMANVTSKSTQKNFNLSDIDGRVAGGAISGTFQMWFEKQPRYEAKLTLADASLASLVLSPKASEEEKKRIGTGKVTASLAVQEIFGPSPDRTGRGELMVRDGTIYNVPLAMGLMQVATLRLPVSSAFDRASMSYYLRDDKITFERILLESPGINLAGLGTLSLADKNINMTLVTESPNEFNIPFLTFFIQSARNELFQLSVTGPVDNPKIVPVPLSSLAKTLQNVLPKHK